MTRRLFPVSDTLVASDPGGAVLGDPVRFAHGLVLELFADAACTTPLDATDLAGAAISSVTVVGATVPAFLGPDDGRDLVYGRPAGRTGAGLPLRATIRVSDLEAISRSGIGSPDGVVVAPIGSRYTDTAATSGAITWIKASRSDAYGWRVDVGDTGWRRYVAPLLDVASGEYGLRRIGDRVYFRAVNAVLVAGTGAAYFFDGTRGMGLPVGFRGPSSFQDRTMQAIGLQSNAIDRQWISAFSTSAVIWAGTNGAGPSGTRPTSGLAGAISWLTEDSWPAGLPGTAV